MVHRNKKSVRGEEKKEKMTERGRDIDIDTELERGERRNREREYTNTH